MSFLSNFVIHFTFLTASSFLKYLSIVYYKSDSTLFPDTLVNKVKCQCFHNKQLSNHASLSLLQCLYCKHSLSESKQSRSLFSARRNTIASARHFVVGSNRYSETFVPIGKCKMSLTCSWTFCKCSRWNHPAQWHYGVSALGTAFPIAVFFLIEVLLHSTKQVSVKLVSLCPQVREMT